jgi:hypothetical protein
MKGRDNAHGIDLNRNFPDQYQDPTVSPFFSNKKSLLFKTMRAKEVPWKIFKQASYIRECVLLQREPKPEPEVAALMEWTKSYPFVLSANLHGGSVVANYPFDGQAPGQAKNQENLAPDNAVFQHLAHLYARVCNTILS